MRTFKIIILVFISNCLVNLVSAQQQANTQQQNQQPVAQQQNQTNFQQQVKPKPITRLLDSPECHDDIVKYCPSKGDQLSDLAVLKCMYNEVKDLNSIDKECHHLLYTYKKNMTQAIGYDDLALRVCKDDIRKLVECQNIGTDDKGHLMSCLVDNMDNVTDATCEKFLTNMASLIFTDYRLVYKFTDKCSNDIERLKCGRLDLNNDDEPTEQGKTIECLQNKVDSLNELCKKEIFKISTLQSEDFHLDRALYFACKDDRDQFCDTVVSGKGNTYKCLMRNKFNALMSKPCQEQLTRRQQLIVRYPIIDINFMKACVNEIREHKCDQAFKAENTTIEKLSVVLVCLGTVAREGGEINAECRKEMLEHRKNLMSDFKLSPGIVTECNDEIEKFCRGFERGGKTLHCLFRNSKKATSKTDTDFKKSCLFELKKLIKITDAGEDVRVDQDLYQACQNLITGPCKGIKPGDSRVIKCLLKQRDEPDMTDECDEKLIEIEFFIARDWRLDPEIYKACKNDAKSRCFATTDNWVELGKKDTGEQNIVFSCLYQLALDDEQQNKIDPKCAAEVKRIMHLRAKSVDLIPEVQENCAYDLQNLCGSIEKSKKGEELRCLQKSIEKIEDEDCLEAVKKVTEFESKDIGLDPILIKNCKQVIDQQCANEKADNGELFECLIKAKNDPNLDEKCKAGIEHHQIVNMEDVRFNYKFKRDCSKSIDEYCSDEKKKIDVIECLSKLVLDDTLNDQEYRVDEKCRNQLTFERLQMNEDARLDSNFMVKCRDDIQTYCKNVPFGKGQVLECLKTAKGVSAECSEALFNRESIDLRMQKADYRLKEVCGPSIKTLCDTSNNDEYLPCLRKHLTDPKLDAACRRIVVNRIIFQNKDARLNPSLWKQCRADINVNCASEFIRVEQGEKLNGRIVKCLKQAFVKRKLAKNCELEIETVMREAATVDNRLDPLLTEACAKEIQQLCSNQADNEKEDCLRIAFQKGSISKLSECAAEVKRIIAEGVADIHTDNQLMSACSIDLTRYCIDVAPGAAQQLKCLLGVQDSSKNKLTVKCSDVLMSRKVLWNLADTSDDLYGFKDLLQTIHQSKNRSYLLAILSVIFFIIFCFGYCLRPATKYMRLSSKVK